MIYNIEIDRDAISDRLIENDYIEYRQKEEINDGLSNHFDEKTEEPKQQSPIRREPPTRPGCPDCGATGLHGCVGKGGMLSKNKTLNDILREMGFGNIETIGINPESEEMKKFNQGFGYRPPVDKKTCFRETLSPSQKKQARGYVCTCDNCQVFC